jgi:hypothetical protein
LRVLGHPVVRPHVAGPLSAPFVNLPGISGEHVSILSPPPWGERVSAGRMRGSLAGSLPLLTPTLSPWNREREVMKRLHDSLASLRRASSTPFSFQQEGREKTLPSDDEFTRTDSRLFQR